MASSSVGLSVFYHFKVKTRGDGGAQKTIGGLKEEAFCFSSVLLSMSLACDNEIHFQEMILKFFQEIQDGISIIALKDKVLYVRTRIYILPLMITIIYYYL